MTEPTHFRPAQASAPALRTITSRRVGRNVWDDVPNRVDLVFDGYCGFCTRSVRIIRRIDRHDRVNVLAGQAAGTHQRTGVSTEESVRAAWAVSPTGYRIAGAPAIALSVAVAIGCRLPLVAWKIPTVPGLLDRVYQWIADNRRRFRGDTPWCEQRVRRCVTNASVDGS